MLLLKDKSLQCLIDEIHDNEAECFIVGGHIRDYLIGKKSYDIDIEIHDLDVQKFELIISMYSEFVTYGNFGVYKLANFPNVEFSFPRTEKKIGTKHNDFEVNINPRLELEAATMRRDFTVNAMMYSLKNNKLYDFHKGQEDLKNKILRPVSKNFIEDDLRILRGLRFASELGFKLDDSYFELAKSMDITNLSTTRISTEFRKMILGEYFATTLEDFKKVVGKHFCLLNIQENGENSYSKDNIWLHTKQTVCKAIMLSKNLSNNDRFLIISSALFLNIGKLNNSNSLDIADEEYSLLLFNGIKKNITDSKSIQKQIGNIIKLHKKTMKLYELPKNEIIQILEIFNDTLESFLIICAANIAKLPDNSNEPLQYCPIANEYSKTWLELLNQYNELKKKNSGNYFITLGVTGPEIKRLQNKKICEELKLPMKKIGFDVGSTTIKVAILDHNKNTIFIKYERHFSKIRETFRSLLLEIANIINKDEDLIIAITGSGGIGIAEWLDFQYVQEVIAGCEAVMEYNEKTDVIVELGGEDAKVTFIDKKSIDQRMNGICAGGTGAFIDQMASLLQVDVNKLDELAQNATRIYPIAGRCGVFAKTDIQPLINQGALKEDIAKSILHSVVKQTIAGLSQGRKIKGNVTFLGGPLTFSKELRNSFIEVLSLDSVTVPCNSEVYIAIGAALLANEDKSHTLNELIKTSSDMTKKIKSEINRLAPLFEN